MNTRFGPWMATAMVTALAAMPLLDLRTVFYVDWINHLWSIEYFGEYWKQHFISPVVFNTQQVIGMDVAIFYSYHFYALAGVVSAFLGSGLTIRCLVIGVLALQFRVVLSSLVAVHVQRNTAYAVAAVLSWGIYSLTNLYNRSALTEFFAISLLTCSVSTLLVVFLTVRDERIALSAWLQPGFFYALAAVTHPLSAAFGGLFVIALGVIVVALTRSWRLLLFGAASGAAILVILSPWLFAYHRFGALLPLNNASLARASFQTIGYFPGSLDAVWSRFSPVPVDARSLANGIREVSTPYLDAQVSIPLLLLLAARLFELRSDYRSLNGVQWALGSLALIFTAYFAALSVRPVISESFGGVFNILQFAYRLVAYINLAALAAFMALSSARKENNGIHTAWLSFCLALALAGLVTKLYHAGAIERPSSTASVTSLASELRLPAYHKPYPVWFPGMTDAGQNSNILPPTYYGHPSYSMLGAYRPPPDDAPAIYAALVPETGPRFGNVGSLEITLPGPSLVITNVQPFPWNRLSVDGFMPPARSLFVIPKKSSYDPFRRFDGLAVRLGAGRHVIDYHFVPDRPWIGLVVASWIVLAIWFTALVLTRIPRPPKPGTLAAP
jgi:hypothetical protein